MQHGLASSILFVDRHLRYMCKTLSSCMERVKSFSCHYCICTQILMRRDVLCHSKWAVTKCHVRLQEAEVPGMHAAATDSEQQVMNMMVYELPQNMSHADPPMSTQLPVD